MIEIRGLTVRFGDKTVLDKISTSFPDGKVHGIVGLNGSGKTTFFNTLSCVVRPAEGKVYYNGYPLSYKTTGYLETQNFFYSRITGKEYLELFRQTNPDFRLEALQEYTRLPLNHLIESYSTGMKKKLALLGLLKQDKPVYLLDEPFNSLDLESNKVLELIILALKDKGRTILVSSHILEPLLTVCDTMHLLEKGKFTHTFERDRFGQIEQELFGHFREQAASIIKKAV